MRTDPVAVAGGRPSLLSRQDGAEASLQLLQPVIAALVQRLLGQPVEGDDQTAAPSAHGKVH